MANHTSGRRLLLVLSLSIPITLIACSALLVLCCFKVSQGLFWQSTASQALGLERSGPWGCSHTAHGPQVLLRMPVDVLGSTGDVFPDLELVVVPAPWAWRGSELLGAACPGSC